MVGGGGLCDDIVEEKLLGSITYSDTPHTRSLGDSRADVPCLVPIQRYLVSCGPEKPSTTGLGLTEGTYEEVDYESHPVPRACWRKWGGMLVARGVISARGTRSDPIDL